MLLHILMEKLIGCAAVDVWDGIGYRLARVSRFIEHENDCVGDQVLEFV